MKKKDMPQTLYRGYVIYHVGKNKFDIGFGSNFMDQYSSLIEAKKRIDRIIESYINKESYD